jgi:hypothetical protein
VSDVIETYIRRNSGMTEDAAFEGFLREERIRTWVGEDAARRDRLRREFTRVWQGLQPPTTPSRTAPPLVRPASPSPQPQPVVVRPIVEVQAPPPVRHASPAGAAPRQLSVLCPTCGKMDVWLEGGEISCRACATSYDNMLDLIPVKPVGVLEFYFGTGWNGLLTAGAIVLGLISVYLLLHTLS